MMLSRKRIWKSNFTLRSVVRMTTREKLATMSNEDLAEILSNLVDPCRFCIDDSCGQKTCVDNIKRWLESEAEITQ